LPGLLMMLLRRLELRDDHLAGGTNTSLSCLEKALARKVSVKRELPAASSAGSQEALTISAVQLLALSAYSLIENIGGFPNTSDGGRALAHLVEQANQLMVQLSPSVDDQNMCNIKVTFARLCHCKTATDSTPACPW
jgi:hypothetical protein